MSTARPTLRATHRSVIGQKVATLVNGYYTPGSYNVIWDGAGASSGIYYYNLKTGNTSETMKMTLLK